MRFLPRFFILSLMVSVVSLVEAQDFPKLEKTLPPVNIARGTSTTVDLTGLFSVDNVNGPLVQLSLDTGYNLYLELYPDVAPLTVANFQAYLNEGSYNKTFIHRADKREALDSQGNTITVPFVIQGGGYFYSDGWPHVTQKTPVANEFKLSNLAGTVAMAKVDGDLDSATSEWFFNLYDNSYLDAPDLKFTVFGRLIGNGLAISTNIANLPVTNQNAPDDPDGPFGQMPYFTDNTVTPSQDYFVTVEAAAQIPLLKLLPNGAGFLTITATSSNPAAVQAEITASGLKLTSGTSLGSSTITIRATDPYARTLDTTLTATSVNPRLPTVSIRSVVSRISESGRTAGKIRISRSGSRSRALRVRLSTSGSTASNGSDCNGISSVATILAGRSYVDVLVVPKKDTRQEGTEILQETVQANSAYNVAAVRSASVAIVDDDVPTVTMTVIDGDLGESSTNTAVVRFTRTGAANNDLPVYLTVDGKAIYGTDYTISPEVFIIPMGQSTADATFTAINDTIHEGTESIIIIARPVPYYNIPTAPVSLSLLDAP